MICAPKKNLTPFIDLKKNFFSLNNLKPVVQFLIHLITQQLSKCIQFSATILK